MKNHLKYLLILLSTCFLTSVNATNPISKSIVKNTAISKINVPLKKSTSVLIVHNEPSLKHSLRKINLLLNIAMLLSLFSTSFLVLYFVNYSLITYGICLILGITAIALCIWAEKLMATKSLKFNKRNQLKLWMIAILGKCFV